ncbi:cupin domain-containing protein [Kyrpidia tusciae]|uniref:Cupin 2 conserved barrel domain protein n=1 Tax=Kyrpidia tusciae (strain DSM 2912 / NBRC 15312 / T2) TaxID=562970 RepID=D5WSJ1_KYRT2|nr:cupin domain-containing protein [Kyrpidia tusciae]ADG07010.1 Cupin 2 conserved barrel domain protein [Kyrpidia tusciae DSM 2912]MBE3551687.1 cupin domain-containing protein [Kyrpidia tusciae]
MAFYTIDSLPKRETAPGRLNPVLQGQYMTAVTMRPTPAAKVPVHSHAEETIGVVIEGYVDLEIDGEAKRVSKGEFYHIPPGTPHSANGGEGLVVEFFGPPRADLTQS